MSSGAQKGDSDRLEDACQSLTVDTEYQVDLLCGAPLDIPQGDLHTQRISRRVRFDM